MPNNRDDDRQRGKGSPLLPACRLFKKTSAHGGGYLTGRLGGLRVLVMPKRGGDEGDHTHTLLIGEAATREGSEGGR